jgi:DNA-binding XRE family transcriptional regulator
MSRMMKAASAIRAVFSLIRGRCRVALALAFCPMDDATRSRLRTLGNWIKVLRTGREWTQEALAHEAGLNPRMVGIIERGERDWGISHLWPLAAAFQVELSYLLSPDERAIPPSPRRESARLHLAPRTRD